MSCSLKPFKNPVTGADHFVLIRLPNGFEFRNAEMANGAFRSCRDLEMDNSGVYAYITQVAYGPYGIVEEKTLGGNT